MVTLDNYEEYLALYADGELTAAQQQELAAFIQLHPYLRREMEAYGSTRIANDEMMIYPAKNNLRRPEETPKVIVLNRKRIYSIAAALLLIIIAAAIYRYTQTGEANNMNIVKETPVTPSINTPIPTPPVDTAMTPQQTSTPQQARAIVQQQPVRHRHISGTKAPVKITPPLPAPHEIAVQEKEPVPIQTTQEHTYKQEQYKMPVTVAATQTAPAPEKQKHSFLDSLPIDEDKKKGLETVASAIENITDTKLSVKISNKNLVINF